MNDTKVAEELEDKQYSSADTLCSIEENKLKKSKKKKMKRILAGIGIAVLIIVASSFCMFCVLRMRGEKSLKTVEQYTTYEGKRYKYDENIINILCLGIDKAVPMSYIESLRGHIGMADTILLVSIDMKRDEVKVIAIPRDTMTEVQTIDEDGQFAEKVELQICYQYAYGISMEQSNELTVDAVSRLLYDIPIQRCCAINFDALPILNDAIGGVDVVVQQDDLEELVPELKYGETVHLEGKFALSFLRARNRQKVDGSFMRTQRQMQYAIAFAEKAKKEISEDPTLPITLFQELQKEKDLCTDITAEDISYLLPEIRKLSFSKDIVESLEGENILGESGFAEFYMDVDAAKELVINTFYEEV